MNGTIAKRCDFVISLVGNDSMIHSLRKFIFFLDPAFLESKRFLKRGSRFFSVPHPCFDHLRVKTNELATGMLLTIGHMKLLLKHTNVTSPSNNLKVFLLGTVTQWCLLLI